MRRFNSDVALPPTMCVTRAIATVLASAETAQAKHGYHVRFCRLYNLPVTIGTGDRLRRIYHLGM